MKLYLAGGMSYRELLFGGAIMDLYLAIGGGQWNKYVAPTLKEMGGVKRNENLSGSSCTDKRYHLMRNTKYSKRADI